MGLVNARNLRKAKQLLEKNRHKVGDVVEKAGTQLDKVSKGKTANVTSKASDAAKKYSAGDVRHHGLDSSTGEPMSGSDPATPREPMTAEEARLRQAQATASAANAVSGAANAFTKLINKAAAKAENTNATRGDAAAPAKDDSIPLDEYDKG